MPPPTNIDARKNADWLAGATHGRAAERARLGLVLGPFLADLYQATWDVTTAEYQEELRRVFAELELSPPGAP